MAVTATDEFNTALEVQQSTSLVLAQLSPPAHDSRPPDLIAGVDLAAQENSIRDLLNQEAPLRTVLRLLCLYSVISGGLKPKIIEEFKRDILQVRLLRFTAAPSELTSPRADIRLSSRPSATLSAEPVPHHPRHTRQVSLRSRSQASSSRSRRCRRARPDGY